MMNSEVSVVLRLLNGPLCGCEYRLADGATLFVVAAEDDLAGDVMMPEFPDGAIVVPMEGGVNFEIVLDDNARDGFRVHVLQPQLEEHLHVWQEVCQVGPLSFAVRPDDEPWSPGILDALPAVEVAPAASASRHIQRWALGGVIALFVVLAGGLALWMTLQDNTRVKEAAEIVAGSSDPYLLAKGRDGAVYIFAESDRGAVWARQALTREGLTATVHVATLREEEARLNRLLLESYPALAHHRLKLADPAKPVLMVSQERADLSKPTRPALIASMMQWMPYAQTASIATWSDSLLDQQAKEGLDRLGMGYVRSQHAGSVTYALEGSLTDIDLSRLQDFTDGFYRDFGARYVHFSVELKEDWLKGKSFKYGRQGYVKMAPNHWFFSQSF